MTKNNEVAPEFDPVALARDLLRTVRSGALATLDPAGFPFASLVTVATDTDGSPLLLLSRLSAHTANLDRDARASLLLVRGGRGDALAHPRLTLIGRVRHSAEPRHRRRFLARHPKAQLYADFPDFGFRTFAVERAHLNGGFARAATLTAEDLLSVGSPAMVDAEERLVRLLNTEQSDLVQLCARPNKEAPAAPWQVSGVDPDGVDLLAGDLTTRVAFPCRVGDPDVIAGVLSRLAAEARDRVASGECSPLMEVQAMART